MRSTTRALLSDYLQGGASLSTLREFLWGVDWDDSTIPEEERALLLEAEAICAGMDENLETESDLRDFLLAHGPLLALGA